MNSEVANNPINQDVSISEILIKSKKYLLYLKSKILWILLLSLVFSSISVLYVKLTPIKYKAVLSFALDEDRNSSGIGGAAGIASQLGIDVGTNAGGLFSGPNILELLKSKHIIQKTLLNTIINDTQKNISLAEYFIRNKNLNQKLNTTKLSNEIYFPIAHQGIKIKREQDSILKLLYQIIIKDNLDVFQKDKKASIVNIEVSSRDEKFSKIFCESLANMTSDFYVKIKSAKSQNNVDILQKQVDSVRLELTNSIFGVANSNDNIYNLNPSLNIKSAPIRLKQIQVQANTELLKQLTANLELSKVTLRKETPLIQILDSPSYPLDIETKNIYIYFGATFIFSLFLISFSLIVNLIIKQSNF